MPQTLSNIYCVIISAATTLMKREKEIVATVTVTGSDPTESCQSSVWPAAGSSVHSVSRQCAYWRRGDGMCQL